MRADKVQTGSPKCAAQLSRCVPDPEAAAFPGSRECVRLASMRSICLWKRGSSLLQNVGKGAHSQHCQPLVIQLCHHFLLQQ
jgi:hypothetical protein